MDGEEEEGEERKGKQAAQGQESPFYATNLSWLAMVVCSPPPHHTKVTRTRLGVSSVGKKSYCTQITSDSQCVSVYRPFTLLCLDIPFACRRISLLNSRLSLLFFHSCCPFSRQKTKDARDNRPTTCLPHPSILLNSSPFNSTPPPLLPSVSNRMMSCRVDCFVDGYVEPKDERVSPQREYLVYILCVGVIWSTITSCPRARALSVSLCLVLKEEKQPVNGPIDASGKKEGKSASTNTIHHHEHDRLAQPNRTHPFPVALFWVCALCPN